MPLRPYQSRCIDQARSLYREGRRAICIVAPCGAGKTILGATIASAMRGQVLWIAHRQELVEQARSKLPAGVRVATVQGLLASGERPAADLLVLDECVTGDAIVGDKTAAEVRVGDLVDAWDGRSVVRRAVSRVFVRQPRSLVTLSVQGARLTVTFNHPVWVSRRGYVAAGQLCVGDVLLVQGAPGARLLQRQHDQVLLEGLRASSESGSCHRATRPAGRLCGVREANGMGGPLEGDVFARVPSRAIVGDDGAHESEVRVGTNDAPQPDGKGGNPREDVAVAPGDRAPSAGPGREWPPADASATRNAREVGGWLGGGVGDPDTDAARVGDPGQLQGRPGERGRDGGCRNRRGESPVADGKGARPEEGGGAHLARLDGLEVHEPTSDGAFGGLCPGGLVYNFEVDGEHNFFANGILTHNCHHYAADAYALVATHYSSALRIGLTATPERSDGRALGDLFDSLVVAASYSELLAGGWITPCEVIAPASRHSRLAENPAEAVASYAGGRQVIVFCSGVAAARQTAAEIPGAEAVDGETPGDVRAETIARFRAGTTRVLTSCQVLTEGFDAPETAVVVLARGTAHVSTYLQMVGRALRPAAGKSAALLVDLVGACWEHGWPTDDRDYSLEGRAIRRRGEPKPVVWQCRACGRCYPGAPADRLCPACGERIPEPRALVVARRRLERIERDKLATDDTRNAVFAQLQALARARGYKPGWAAVQFKAKYGCWPRRVAS